MINNIVFSGLLLCCVVMFYVNFSSMGKRISSSSKFLHIFRRRMLIESKNKNIILGHKLHLIFIMLILIFTLYAETSKIPEGYEKLILALILGGGFIVRTGISALSLYYDNRYKASKKNFDFVITFILFFILYTAFYKLLLK